ncbi:NAD-dependent epimerase/dehydratase family protein [Jatrophihabitans sp. YIM 134969]
MSPQTTSSGRTPRRPGPLPTVLVTGISRYLGSRVAAALAADPAVGRVIGVDTVAPGRADLDRLGRTEFVRADIRNPLIAKVIAGSSVDTVVHASVTATPHGAGGRAPMKEMNVLGTMQLLAACQKADSVKRLVLKSTTAVYGSSPRDPAVFAEDTPPRALPRSGYGKDAVEVEGYVRGFGRRRPDVDVTVLRFSNFVGPTIDSALVRYFTLPILPTALGHDPRLQFLHETDAVEILRLAAVAPHPGVFNVAGDGTLLLSQAIRRAGKLPVAIPGPAVDTVSRWVRRSGLVDFSPEQLGLLSYGRVVDTTRVHDTFGFTPRYSSEQAFEAFLRDRPVPPVVAPDQIAATLDGLGGLIGLRPTALASTLAATPRRAVAAAGASTRRGRRHG